LDDSCRCRRRPSLDFIFTEDLKQETRLNKVVIRSSTTRLSYLNNDNHSAGWGIQHSYGDYDNFSSCASGPDDIFRDGNSEVSDSNTPTGRQWGS
jgi:hypothetical protein